MSSTWVVSGLVRHNITRLEVQCVITKEKKLFYDTDTRVPVEIVKQRRQASIGVSPDLLKVLKGIKNRHFNLIQVQQQPVLRMFVVYLNGLLKRPTRSLTQKIGPLEVNLISTAITIKNGARSTSAVKESVISRAHLINLCESRSLGLPNRNQFRGFIGRMRSLRSSSCET